MRRPCNVSFRLANIHIYKIVVMDNVIVKLAQSSKKMTANANDIK